MTEQRPLKVFLCHAKADKPAARNLYRYLHSKGMDPWLDEEKLLPGQNWRLEIPNAIVASDVIIICLSKNSVDKEGYVQREIKFALDKALEMPEGRIFIIPARLEECDVPESLKNYHWVDLFEKNWNRKLMQSLNLRAASLPDVKQAVVTDESSPKIPKPDKKGRPIERPLPPAELAGEGAVGIGGDAKGTTIITGDNNVIVQTPSGEYETSLKKEETPKRAKRDRLPGLKALGLGFVVFLLVIWAVTAITDKFAQAVPTPAAFPTSTTNGTDAKFASQTAAAQTLAASTAASTITSTPNPPTAEATLGIGSTKISEKDGMTLVFIPAGQFNMGSDDGNNDERPVHPVYLNSYWMDQTEVANKMYALCVDAGACDPPTSVRSSTNSVYYGNPKFNDYPVMNVSWHQAQAYCDWAGRRLPTEAEWEKAARGQDGRTYPWGEGSSCEQANYNISCIGDTTKVGSYLSGQSPYGIFDLAGNVWEWIMDWYDSDHYANSITRNPQGPAIGQSRVFRGGSWNDDNDYLRSALRGRGTPSYSSNMLGFRCVVSEP